MLHSWSSKRLGLRRDGPQDFTIIGALPWCSWKFAIWKTGKPSRIRIKSTKWCWDGELAT